MCNLYNMVFRSDALKGRQSGALLPGVFCPSEPDKSAKQTADKFLISSVV